MIQPERVDSRPHLFRINFKNSINLTVIAALTGVAAGAAIGGGITYLEMQERVRQAYVTGTLMCPPAEMPKPGEPMNIPNYPIPIPPKTGTF